MTENFSNGNVEYTCKWDVRIAEQGALFAKEKFARNA
jgi:hypothetical protein